jgi:hypothetical protein
MRIDRVGLRGRDHQRVAVRRQLREHVSADIAVCAGPIFDHDRLFERHRKLLRDKTADQIGRSPGGPGDRQLDAMIRIFRRVCGR